MKNLVIILLTLWSFQSTALEIENVNLDSKILEINIILTTDSIFPEKCLGIWEGIMYIYNQGHLVDSVKVLFTAAKTEIAGIYTWKTEYLSPTRPMIKDYKLIVDNSKEGRYILDEGDGVRVVEYSVNNKMYSVFKVEDICITSSTELVDDQLIFEVTSGKELDEVQGVKNYSITNVQRVVLIKTHQ